MAKYQRTSVKTSKKSSFIGLTLDQLVLEGAKRLVVEVLQNEISECVGRQRYERQSEQANKMYRNGYGKERHLTVGCGTFPLRDVFPHTRRQRCWVHKMRNILYKVPTKAHDEVRQALREMYNARSKTDAIYLKKTFIQRYRTRYPKAVKSLI